MATVSGRVRHYGDFYGLPAPSSSPARPSSPSTDAPSTGPNSTGPNSTESANTADDRPLMLIHGNCQAEALRVLLAASDQLGVRTIRVPPVFELTAADMPFLREVAGRCQILLSQPVSQDYRELPLGTDQVAAMMPAGARVIRWPVIRFAGLHPFQAIVRDPRDLSRDPPLVPYHDLRTLASAADGQDRFDIEPPASAIRSLAAGSIAELQRREQAQCDICISDFLVSAVAGDMATINHPGNRLLIELAHRVQSALEAPPQAADPGRQLLGEVIAPVEATTLTALGASGRARRSWRVSGHRVLSRTVHRVQWRWYTENPVVVEAGFRRHGAALELLGLA